MINKRKTAKNLELPLITPGEILLEEFLKPMGITQYKLSKELHVSQTKVSEIVKGKRGISAETALRLGKFFGMSPEYWMNLQSLCELQKAKRKVSKKIDKEVKNFKEAA